MGRKKENKQKDQQHDYHDRLLNRYQLVAARIMLRLTTEDVARITCMSKTTINNLEGGNTKRPQRRTFKTLKQMFEERGIEFGKGGWVRYRVDVPEKPRPEEEGSGAGRADDGTQAQHSTGEDGPPSGDSQQRAA